MKLGMVILLTGLLAVFAHPSQAESGRAIPTAQINMPAEIGYDDGIPAPRDEFGPDWIIYDDGRAQTLNTSRNYWSRVIFTPNTEFELRGIRFQPLNQYNNASQCFLRVYRHDNEDGDLGDMVYEHRYARLPVWDGNWIDHEFPDEDDYVIFDAREDFSIMYGPAPGGPYQGQDGSGWWNIFDGNTEVDRSWVATGNNPPADFGRWEGPLQGDLLVRANGEYLERFVDLGIVVVTNGDPNDDLTGKYLMNPGEENSYKAWVKNYGSDVDVFIVTFRVFNSDGDVVESWEVIGEDLAAEDSVAVQSDEDTWVAPDELGHYYVVVEVEAGEDANADNNIRGLDQIVFDPMTDDEQWVGYVDDNFESATNWNEDSGWGCVFYHPGGEQALAAKAFRVAVQADAAEAYEGEFAIAVADMQDGLFSGPPEVRWSGVAESNGQAGDQWIEVALDEEDWVTINENQALIVTYFFVEGLPIQIDATPPAAGTNNLMPFVMISTVDDGGEYFRAGSGDFPIEAMFTASNEAPEGPRIRIEPDPLAFGYGLAQGEDHTIEARFINYGNEELEISSIQVPPSASRFITIGDEAFNVDPVDTVVVPITFRADTLVNLNTQFLVTNNSRNQRQYRWPLQASTMTQVILPEVTGLDFGTVELGAETSLDLVFLAPGPQAVMVDEIRIPEEYQGYFSVAPESFEIPAEGMAVVTITFMSEEEVQIRTEFLIINNSQNDPELDIDISAGALGVREHVREGLPENWSISQNYPNPFNPLTTVDIALANPGRVEFSVFNMSGSLVKRVFSGNMPAGYHSIDFNAGGLPAGVYLYRVSSGEFVATKKMILLK